MDAFQRTIHRTVLDYIGLHDENQRLTAENQRLTAQNQRLTAQNQQLQTLLLDAGTTYLQLTGPGGSPVYYTGTQNNFNWTTWTPRSDVIESRHVPVQLQQDFSFSDIATMEVHLSGRVFPLADVNPDHVSIIPSPTAGQVCCWYDIRITSSIEVCIFFDHPASREEMDRLRSTGILPQRFNPATLTRVPYIYRSRVSFLGDPL